MLPELDEYIDTTQAGVIAKRHPRTIVSWIRAKHLKASKLPGARGHYRILFADLKNLLEREYVPQK